MSSCNSVGKVSSGENNSKDDFEVAGYLFWSNSAKTRTNFTHSVMQMVRQFDLDGIDIDWEFPDAVEPSASDFVLLMEQLRDSLHKTGKKLTAAVESYHHPYVYGINDEVFEIADWINIMAYANYGIGSHCPHLITPHSPYWLAV